VKNKASKLTTHGEFLNTIQNTKNRNRLVGCILCTTTRWQ